VVTRNMHALIYFRQKRYCLEDGAALVNLDW